MMAEGVIIAAVTAVSGLVVAFWQRRGQHEATAAGQYQALVDDLQELRREQREENTELRLQLQKLQTEYEQLRRALARLEDVEAALRQRYQVAVEYISTLRSLVPVARRPPVPEELRGDIT
ncbi:hypothetical protein MHT86_10160 [Corynebacterium mastitidis]|uniref:Uncharacterized protein n=1 Tax=Corynebacterium mastitidis TaxID=161890 RepID=A0A2N0X8Y3_9CORY|nr:hypothetical protein [Corynebacterium mastitidis]MCH6197848.1 hypothetical protein [Corynebacterium mastitidis]PKF69162.1 hypothetical protein CXB45_03195 [Corynebacterium mastitidis]